MNSRYALPSPSGFKGLFTDDGGAVEAVSGSTGPVSIRPAAVAAPADTSDVIRLVEAATREGWTLTPRGGGTGMPGGNVGPGIIVDLVHGFSDVQDIDPSNAVVRAGVGARMSQLVDAAAATGLDLPPVPSSADRCTLGGVLANNAAGARSFRHGSIRAWVRGLEVVLADGRVLDLDLGPGPGPFEPLLAELRENEEWHAGWPQVRKNSSGYALDAFRRSGRHVDLIIGSEGTLGIITRADIALRRAPAARAVHVMQIPAVGDLAAIGQLADDVGGSACEFLGNRFLQMGEVAADPIIGEMVSGSWGVAIVEVEGANDEVEERSRRLREQLAHLGFAFEARSDEEGMRTLWGIRHRASPTIARNAGPTRTSVQFIEDAVVPPANLTAYLTALDRILADATMDAVIFGHAGDANVHVNPLVDFNATHWRDSVSVVLNEVASTVRALGGTLSGEHGDGRIRAPLLDQIWSPTAVQAFRRVKDALDPAGIFNPGVILPLPGQDPLAGMGPPAPDERGS